MYQEYGGGGPDRETPRQEPTPPTPEKSGEEFAAAAEATLDRVEATLESGTLRADQLASIAAELAEIKKRDTDLNVVQFLKLEELEEKVALQQVEQGAAQPDADTPDDNFDLKDDDDATVVPEPAEPEPTPEPEQRGMVLRNGGTNHEPGTDDNVVDGIWEDVESEDFKNAALINELNQLNERIWAVDVTYDELLEIRQRYPKLTLRIAQAVRSLDNQRDKAELDLLSNLSTQIIPDVRARMDQLNSKETKKPAREEADIEGWRNGSVDLPPEVLEFDDYLSEVFNAITNQSMDLAEAKLELQKLDDATRAFREDISSPHGFVAERFSNATKVKIFLERNYLGQPQNGIYAGATGLEQRVRKALENYINEKQSEEHQDAFRKAVSTHPELETLLRTTESKTYPSSTSLPAIETEISNLISQKQAAESLRDDAAKPLDAYGDGGKDLINQLIQKADDRLIKLLEIRLEHFVNLVPTSPEMTKVIDVVREAGADIDPGNATKHIQEIENAVAEARKMTVPPLVIGGTDFSNRVDTTWYTQTIESFLKPATAEVQRLNDLLGKDAARNLLEEEYRKWPLKKMLKDWFTQDVDKKGEPKVALQAAMERKFRLMRSSFVAQYAEALVNAGESSRDAKEKAERKFKDFHDMCEAVFNLTDFGVMRSDSVNTQEFTAIHEAIFKAGNIPGAMAVNAGFNTNSFVLGERESSQLNDEHYLNEEQVGEHMGIVQAIVCAAFQKMRDPDPNNRFNISRGFGASEAEDLIKEVSGYTTITKYDGTPLVNYNIAEELAKYPEEVQEVIKLVASFKLGRDDLGTMASLWHMGRGQKAMKLENGGNGRPDGLLASIIYQVGKNRARENHANALYFIDPTHTEMSAPDARNPNKPDEADKEVRRMMAEVDNYRRWYAPQWDADKHRYVPTKWTGDFPGLDVLFNQVGGQRLKGGILVEEPVRTPNQYHQSEAAYLKVLDLACGSLAPNFSLPSSEQEMEDKIIVLMKELLSEVAKSFAFFGGPNPQPWVDKDGHHVGHAVGVESAPYHQMLLSAVKFYMGSILMAIPGEIPLKIAGIPIQMPGRSKAAEYNKRYDRAVKAMRDSINVDSSSLKGWWQEMLTGKQTVNGKAVPGTGEAPTDGFIGSDLRRRWRDEDLLRNRFHTWRFANVPSLRILDRTGDRADIYMQEPSAPTTATSGWKTASSV